MALIIGITGGIGCGKSYVCDKFKELFHIECYNADKRVQDDIIYREHIKSLIIRYFGQDSYVNGVYNKDKFRKLLFNEKIALKTMNEIIQPEMLKDIKQWVKNQESHYVLIESAIIFENNIQKFFDKIITVETPHDIRVKRLIEKRGMTLENITNVIKNQMSDSERRAKSDYIIINDEDLYYQLIDLNFELIVHN